MATLHRTRHLRPAVAAACLAATAGFASAQDPDLYDVAVLRQIDLTIRDATGAPDPNFYQRLTQNWQAGLDVNLPADLTISGPDLSAPVTRTGVGIRIRGNSSFFFLPPGSQKASFNIEIDDTDPDADLWGYSTLNLNNEIEDPTFCREVAFHNFIRRFTPAGRGNHVVVTINGEPWGVYANVQQYNKRLLEESFADGSGVRIKCPNSGGAALRWFGSNIASYFADYELMNDGNLGAIAAWETLVETCDALNNSPSASPERIDERFAVDGAIWTLVAENLFMDADSYIAKGADFNVYRDPIHGRSVMHQHDGNESWGVSLFGWPGGTTATLSPTFGFTSADRPALSKLMAVPRWRERYFAHMRTMLEDFSWDDLEEQLLNHRDLIDAAVQADPKKLYSHAQFQSNFVADTTISVAGQTILAPGLRRFVDDRRAFLLAHPEIDEPVPTIRWARHAPRRPLPGDTVTVEARVLPAAGAPVGGATLYYRHQPGRYLEVPMADDGSGADATGGDGVYTATLPVSLGAGDLVEVYVSARGEAASGGGMRFFPRHAEGRPLAIRTGFGPFGMRLTEVLYSGDDGEFFELTNVSGAPIDLTGWSMDDSSNDPGVLDLGAAGVVAPGASIVVTDQPAAAFSAAWGLTGVTVIGGSNDARLGRNDVIHVYDAADALVERFSYGDERYRYSVRAKDVSGWICEAGLGRDDPYGWRRSAVGDAQGSWVSAGGDVGSPGAFTAAACDALTFGEAYCTSNPNSTGQVGALTATGSPVAATNDFGLRAVGLPAERFGFVLLSRTPGLVPMAGGSDGVLCLGGTIGRALDTVAMSDASGVYGAQLDLFALPEASALAAAMPGETWRFQLWHRDVTPSPSSNFTGAVEVTFQ